MNKQNTKKMSVLEYIDTHTCKEEINQEVDCSPLFQCRMPRNELMALFNHANKKKSPI